MMGCIPLSSAVAEMPEDPVLRFYVDSVSARLNENILFVDYTDITVDIDSYYQKLDYRGALEKADTAKYTVVLRNGLVESTVIDDSASIKENVVPKELRFIKPWEKNCYFYFFPNDTGLGDLAIGFEPNRPDTNLTPSGVMIFDRSTFVMKKLFMHFRHYGENRSFSIVYEFAEKDFGTAPFHINYQGSKTGTFLNQYFRQDLYFNNYRFR
jgi:hypothetical protein